MAWLIRNWLHCQPDARRLAHQLFSASGLDEQLEQYEKLELHFLNHFIQWLVSQHFVQSMLGVPKSQQHLAALRFPDGMAGYVRYCLRHVFTRIPIAVVDFHDTPSRFFRWWMGKNHVRMEGHLLPLLEKTFQTEYRSTRSAFFGLWRYVIFIGKK